MAEASPKPINYWTFGTGEMIVANEKFITEVGKITFSHTHNEDLSDIRSLRPPINCFKFNIFLVSRIIKD